MCWVDRACGVHRRRRLLLFMGGAGCLLRPLVGCPRVHRHAALCIRTRVSPCHPCSGARVCGRVCVPWAGGAPCLPWLRRVCFHGGVAANDGHRGHCVLHGDPPQRTGASMLGGGGAGGRGGNPLRAEHPCVATPVLRSALRIGLINALSFSTPARLWRICLPAPECALRAGFAALVFPLCPSPSPPPSLPGALRSGCVGKPTSCCFSRHWLLRTPAAAPQLWRRPRRL